MAGAGLAAAAGAGAEAGAGLATAAGASVETATLVLAGDVVAGAADFWLEQPVTTRAAKAQAQNK